MDILRDQTEEIALYIYGHIAWPDRGNNIIYIWTYCVTRQRK